MEGAAAIFIIVIVFVLGFCSGWNFCIDRNDRRKNKSDDDTEIHAANAAIDDDDY